MAPDRTGKRYRSSAGPLRAVSARLDPVTYDAVSSVADSLGLSTNALVNEALSTWLTESAPERLAAKGAEATDAATQAAELIRQLSGEDTTTS